jgi:hypothetical protein
LIENIEKTNDPSLCNVQYNIYEINNILDFDGKRIDYQLFPLQAQEQMEFTSKSDKDRGTLKGILEFRHTIQKHIGNTPELARSISMRYNEVLKAIAYGDILDKKEYVALISQLYDDKDLLQESLEGAKQLKDKKAKLYRESDTSNEAIIRLLENDMLAFNDAYKDQ